MLLSLGFLNCHLQPFGFAVEVRRQRRRGLVDQIWGGGARLLPKNQPEAA